MTRRDFFPTAAAIPAAARRLFEQIDQLDVISTHEHLLSEQERIESKADFFTLAGHYLANDLISAGMPRDRKLDSWAVMEPYWNFVKFTGYGQAFRLAMKDIYGVNEINAAAVPIINSAIAKAAKPGYYRDILKTRGRFLYSVLDDYWHGDPIRPDPEFFVLARKFDSYCTASKAADIKRMEEITGVSITNVAGLRRAVEKRMDQSVAAGMVTIKSTIAYNRPLYFERVSEAAAQADFDLLMREPQSTLPRRLSDHVFHHLLAQAAERKIPVQVHTGLQAGNGNMLANSNPIQLNNLFQLYPTVTFDLFHLGWPWTEEAAALTKMFQNVYIDFCWAHVISPTTSRNVLHQLLDTVPVNKILGFGGDYRYVELSYAHAKMARRNIAQVLSEKVESGFCTAGEALEIARLILSANPARIFPRRG